MTVRVAAIQCDIKIGDIASNLSAVEKWIDAAAARQVQLAVMPECMVCGYAFESRDEAMDHAIELDGPEIQRVAAKIQATDQDLVVSLGALIRVDERLFNAALLINRDGLVAHYRKVHLPQLGVDQFVDRGDLAYRSHRVGDVRIGMAICYDCSFPEPMRVLGLAGADVVALGTNWPVAAARTAEVVPPARSMENHYYFVAANRIGTERGFTFCGKSSICGPDGVVLAISSDDSETMLVADIDLESARNKRIERTAGAHVIDRMADRQPDFYTAIAETNADNSPRANATEPDASPNH